MTAPQLHTLSVQDLEPGMLLHSIARQSGKLMVKSKGKIQHEGVIEQLIASGVQTVLVETESVAHAKPSAPSASPLAQGINPPITEAADTRVTTNVTTLIDTSELNQDYDEEDEYLAKPEPLMHFPALSISNQRDKLKAQDAAEQLIIDCKKLHRRLKVDIEKNMPIDITEAKRIVSVLHQSLMQDPDALLCLSMIRNEGEYLTNHSMHVSILLCHFAQYLGMSEFDCKRLAILGYFFDIGMLKVPKDILNKQGPPTREEQFIIQSHVQHSLDLLAPFDFDNELNLAIEQHHERLDGSGYPNNLAGEDIHKFSRMLAIVDCYDAMTTNRPFQKKASPASALKIIADKEYGYDFKLALKFIKCLGVYPVGSLVILNNQHIALVIKNSAENALKPKVKSFYSISHAEYVAPKLIDLASHTCKFHIIKPTLPEHYRLDLNRFSL
jgi:HD-GYP domain-containing protein (c-di-GMP phosphodiesterase class II)